MKNISVFHIIFFITKTFNRVQYFCQLLTCERIGWDWTLDFLPMNRFFDAVKDKISKLHRQIRPGCANVN